MTSEPSILRSPPVLLPNAMRVAVGTAGLVGSVGSRNRYLLGVRSQVVRIGGPDLTFHPAKGKPGIPDGLQPVAAITKGRHAHVEDRIQGEEHAEHHHRGDEYLHERETRFLLT